MTMEAGTACPAAIVLQEIRRTQRAEGTAAVLAIGTAIDPGELRAPGQVLRLVLPRHQERPPRHAQSQDEQSHKSGITKRHLRHTDEMITGHPKFQDRALPSLDVLFFNDVQMNTNDNIKVMKSLVPRTMMDKISCFCLIIYRMHCYHHRATSFYMRPHLYIDYKVVLKSPELQQYLSSSLQVFRRDIMGQEIPGLKKEWPLLLGKTYKEAETQIKKDRPDVRIEKICLGEVILTPKDEGRVEVWINPTTSKVHYMPKVG
ncbi:hypothetical protein ACP70R_008206 [Stipagrostis hirtigluma subsp. patula]